MTFRLSPESIKSLQRIDSVRQTLAHIVVEMDDDNALAETLEEATLSEEQILNIQKAYLNAVEPLMDNDVLLDVVQQQADLRKSLIDLTDTLDDIQKVQIQTLQPLFETESVQNAIDDPAGAVEEYGEPEATPKPGEVTLSADQEGVRIAWGASVITANKILNTGREQIDNTPYTDEQFQAAIMILAVPLLYGAVGDTVAASAAISETFTQQDTFAEAWKDTVNKAEETVEEPESGDDC